jgi:hypothetical protein
VRSRRTFTNCAGPWRGRTGFFSLSGSTFPQRMNEIRCAYAGAVLNSGLTPDAVERALPQVSLVKVIPCFGPRCFPPSKREAAKASLL